METYVVAMIAAGGAVLGGLVGAWLTSLHGRKLNDRRLGREILASVTGLLNRVPSLHMLHAQKTLQVWHYMLVASQAGDLDRKALLIGMAGDAERHCFHLALEVQMQEQALAECLAKVAALWPGPDTAKLVAPLFKPPLVAVRFAMPATSEKIQETLDGFRNFSKAEVKRIRKECDERLYRPIREVMAFVESRLQREKDLITRARYASVEFLRRIKDSALPGRESCQLRSVPQQPDD